jgi:ribulose-bisphosphate carboxylase small chain
MRALPGAFAFLPDLTEEQIRRQVDYCLEQGWAIAIETADDVRPRDTPWQGFGGPLAGARETGAVMARIAACRQAHPTHHLRINALDAAEGGATIRLSFIISRPRQETAFRTERSEPVMRSMRYRGQPFPVERRLAAAGR